MASALTIATSGGIRGLSVFISDIRKCANKEEEKARVDKELANIRTKFKSEKTMSSYDRKKYVWKMLYIFMLGYDVDFGHMEALGLISSTKYAEKQVGYSVTSVMLNETHDFLRLVINSIRNDLIGRNETFQCLALTCVGNVGGKEYAEVLAADVQKLLMSSGLRPIVRKKAALCLLRLYRKSPESVNVDSWGPEQMRFLLDERDIGVLTSIVALLTSMAGAQPTAYMACYPKCVQILERTVYNLDIPDTWKYYDIPAPWLQIKLMRVLQFFPPPEEPQLRHTLLQVMQTILTETEVVKHVNKSNAVHAVLFEAIALVMHLDAGEELTMQCVALLGKFINVREPNIKYLGLDHMSRLAIIPELLHHVQAHQSKIVATLNEADISIRRRALDLIFSMCDDSNAREIMKELLDYLPIADFSLREELSLKMAILAERFAVDKKWYLDVILELIDKAGDYVAEDIWFAVVQMVTNTEDLQEYAASAALRYLKKGRPHEVMVKLAAFILGEHGDKLSVPAPQQWKVLHESYAVMPLHARVVMMSAYAKMLTNCPNDDGTLRAKITQVFVDNTEHSDAEVQQRAVEYLALVAPPEGAAWDPHGPQAATAAKVLEQMPVFPQRASVLERHLADKEVEGADGAIHRERAASAAAESAPRSSGAGPSEVHLQLPPEPTSPKPGSPPAAPPAAAPPAPLDDLLSGSPAKAPPEERSEGGASSSAGGAGGGSVMDMLGELMDAPAPAAPAAPAAADPFAGMDDLSTLTAAAPTEAIHPLGSLKEWHRKLCASADHFKDQWMDTQARPEVLYDDINLNIGLHHMYKGGQGKVVLYHTCKSAAPLTKLVMQVSDAPGLKLAVQHSPNVSAGVLKPGAAAAGDHQSLDRTEIMVLCYQPFLDPPELHLSYTTQQGQTLQQTVRLPIVINKFLIPYPVTDRNDFFARWNMFKGPPQKVVEVLHMAPALAEHGLPAVQGLFNALKLNVVPGLDPNKLNLVTAAAFAVQSGDGATERWGAAAQGDMSLCIVRLESDPNNRSQVRITVASADKVVTSRLKDMVLMQLKEFA